MAASRDFWLVAIGRLATALVAMAGVRAATAFLAPAQYGELALLIAVQMFCGLFLINPVGQHINRHTHQWWDERTLLSRLTSYRWYVLGVSAIGAAIASAVVPYAVPQQSILAAVAMVVMVNAGTWNATSIPMLNMIGFRGAAVVWAIVSMVVGLLVSVILVRWWHTATAWYFGQAIGMIAGATGAGHLLRKSARLAGHEVHTLPLLDRHTIITYCLPLAVATGFMWLQMSGYRFVVEAYWGLSSLGYLAVGLLLASQLWTLVESLAQQFLHPLFYRRIAQSEPHAHKAALSDLLNISGPLYLVLAGATVVGAPYLVKLLAAPQFADAEMFVRLGAVIECCRVLGNLVGNAAHVTKETRSMRMPYAAGAILALGSLIAGGMQRVEIVWVGIILVIAAAVTLGAMLIFMYRLVQFALDGVRWLSGTVAMVVLGVPAFWLAQPNGWVEVIVMLVIIGLLGGIAMTWLLWKNPALHRMLAVRLSEAPIAS